MELGNQIKALRQRKGITQEALAEHLGVTAQAVSKWERNSASPDIALLPALSAYFGVTIDELFALSDDTRMDRIQNMLWDVRFLNPADADNAREFLLVKARREPSNGRPLELLADLENHLAKEHHTHAAKYAQEALRRDPDLSEAHGELKLSMNGWCKDWAYNNRSELTSATVSGESNAYDYDNIGNLETAQEAAETVTAYATNSLNQYTAIGDFVPTFDDAGNQTLVKTSTGIWAVTYDAENRPTLFSNAESSTTVECTYDYMGRRCFKKVTVNGAVTLHQRYIYRGYLQIACCDLTRNNHPALWYITWDPTQPTATRPLAIQKDGTWYTYGLDITKNVCEVFGTTGYLATSYTYSPYGEVITTGNVSQPVQWSSEFRNEELDLVYYNYRDFNASQGEWFVRDAAESSNNLYRYSYNRPICLIDFLGLKEVYHATNLEGVLGILKNGYDSEFLWTGEKNAPPGGGLDWQAKHPHKIKLDIPDKMLNNAKFIPHRQHHAYLLKGEEIFGKNSNEAEAYRWNCVKQYMRKQPENVFELQRKKRSKAMWVIVKKDAIHKSGIKIMEIPNIDVVSQKIPARLKEAGKGIKISKYINLNSSLFVLSSLAIGYEIYTVRHSLKEVNKVVYGWAGGIIGAKYGAAYAASGAVIAGQVGPQVAFPDELLTVPAGALLGSIMGGIIGAFTGETVTEMVDYFTIEKGHEL